MRFLPILSFASAVAAILLPKSAGPYPVSVSVKTLTDKTRFDPYAPKGTRQKRQVLVSLFLPIDIKTTASGTHNIPYMTPAIAADYDTLATSLGLPNDTFASFEVESSYIVPQPRCKTGIKANKKLAKLPLVFLDTGSGQSRLLYGLMARSLASEGYAVVTVDHPYDASVVEFPDGTIVKAANITDDDSSYEKMIQVRAADISFVVDQLKRTNTFTHELTTHKTSLNFDQIVMYGHSLGGATAAEVMRTDPRIKGGLDLDGRFFNPVLTKGLDRPFGLIGRPDHAAEDDTWAQFFPKLRGSRFEMEVANTTHGSFTDFPMLIDSLGLPAEMRSVVDQYLGAISGKRMDVVVKGVVVAFCDFVFGKSTVPAVLKKGQKEIPELTVLRSDIRK